MAQNTAGIVRPGMVYRGSVSKAHGAVVTDSTACRCGQCDWKAYRGIPRRLVVEVKMPDGWPETLFCAGPDSFVLAGTSEAP